MKFKKIAAAAVAAVLAVSLTACGGIKISGVSIAETVTVPKGETVQMELSYDAGNATDEQIAEAASKLEFTWTSSDEAVVTVDSTGKVTAIANGEADISFTIKDSDITDTCKVVVETTVEGIEVPASLELVLGEKDSAELDAKLLPEGATGATLTYTSSDEKVAVVDENGKVTAVGAGECVITTIGILEKSGTALKEDTSAAVSESVSAVEGASADASNDQPTEGVQSVTGETKVTVTEPEQSSESNDNGGAGNNGSASTSNKNNGSAATGGSNTSGGNTGGSVTPPADNGGNTTPTPAPQPDPTPVPQPDPTPVPPAQEGGAAGGSLGDIIPGGGTTDGNGGDAEIGGRPDPAPVSPAQEGGGIGQGNVTIPGGGTTDGNGGDAAPPEDAPIAPPPVL